jgi:DNA-binding NtrC family response regulator
MPSVLVVEDDTSVLEVLREMISRAGYDVECACTHEEVDRALSSRPRDLLVADIQLPDGKIYDLLERRLRLGMKTILITGHFDELPQIVSYSAPYFVKPFALDALLEEIIRQLSAEPGVPLGGGRNL